VDSTPQIPKKDQFVFPEWYQNGYFPTLKPRKNLGPSAIPARGQRRYRQWGLDPQMEWKGMGSPRG